MKDLLSIGSLTPKEFFGLINLAEKIKKNPNKYKNKLFEKTLLTMFEAPSLRTRISFEVAMTQLHGETINFQTEHSPWGIGKETIEDVAKTISQYCDLMAARIYSHEELVKLAKYASIPVINMMTNHGHPCQILGDFLTIKEHLKRTKKIKITYLGDANNNVTYSLLQACAITGNTLAIACPHTTEYYPQKRFIVESNYLCKKYGGSFIITNNPKEAIKDADIVYTDSWMSYRIPKEEKTRRKKELKNFRVTKELFSLAKKTAYFMHCLPANRDHEVAHEVIDGPRSIVFPQARNRMFIQKAILLELMKK